MSAMQAFAVVELEMLFFSGSTRVGLPHRMLIEHPLSRIRDSEIRCKKNEQVIEDDDMNDALTLNSLA